MNFVSIGVYRKIAKKAISEGVSSDSFKHHNIPLSGPAPSPFVPVEPVFDIYEIAHEQLPIGFPLRMGQHMEADDYGTLGLALKTALKARDIFERTKRFLILITDRGSVDMIDEDGISTYLLDRHIHRFGQACSNEASLSVCIKILRQVTGIEIVPIDVSFRHKAPGNVQVYQDFFKCEVLFEQKTNAIRYRTKDLNVPTIKADRSIHEFLVSRMEEEKEGIEIQSNSIASDVESIIKDALPSGIPGIVQVSEHIGMSNRTLTRRLSESGITFRELIKRTQERIANELLLNSQMSVAEIAFQTGFSEQSAFNRAFKRWTGKSPLDFRNS